jgi:hypothetical protein
MSQIRGWIYQESYPAVYIGICSTTSGNRGGVHGKEDYVLCNYNRDGKGKMENVSAFLGLFSQLL